jgi:hypothetical protein
MYVSVPQTQRSPDLNGMVDGDSDVVIRLGGPGGSVAM